MDQSTIYEIKVRGQLDPGWGPVFGNSIDLRTVCEGDAQFTILTCSLEDQAALRGLLSRIWDLNLTIVTLNAVSNPRSGR
ncbi:MAG: hypothetical protein ACP5JG_00585 [Anaerolineae bacterium]